MRGQTSFDFLVGMSVFLLAVMFVVGFIPGMFDPFTTDTGANMIVADRSAARLAEDLLVESVATPGVLNETCTEGFFDTNSPDPAGCRYETNSSDLHAALGVDDLTNLNVTIQSNGSVRTLDGVSLAAGAPPGSTADVIVARRMVFLGGNESMLFVRVW